MIFAARHSPTHFRADAFDPDADDDSLFAHHALAKLRLTLVFATDLALQVDERIQGLGQGNDLGAAVDLNPTSAMDVLRNFPTN